MEMDAGHAGHLLLQVVNVNLLTLIEPLFGAADSRHMNRRRIAALERNFAAVYLGPASAKTSRESPVFCDDRKLPGFFCRRAPSAVVKISQRKGIVNGFLSGIVLLAQEKSAVTVRSVAEIFPGFRIRGVNLPVAVGKFKNDFECALSKIFSCRNLSIAVQYRKLSLFFKEVKSKGRLI